MKKIAFVGIILLAGLFSLQFSLIGPRSVNVVHTDIEQEKLDSAIVLTPVKQVEVVYICPNDSITKRLLEKASSRLL